MATYKETLANNTGNNYGRLGIISAALGFVAVIAIVAGWYSYIYYPEQVVLDGPVTRPIRSEIPLDVMPVLPDDLAETYDEANAAQRERLTTFGAVDVNNGIVRIPLTDAVSILRENDLYEVREDAPPPPEPAQLEPAGGAMELPEAETEEAVVETEEPVEEPAAMETEEAVVETEAPVEEPAAVETEEAVVETEEPVEEPTAVETEEPVEEPAAMETEEVVETEAPVEEPEATEVAPLFE